MFYICDIFYYEIIFFFVTHVYFMYVVYASLCCYEKYIIFINDLPKGMELYVVLLIFVLFEIFPLSSKMFEYFLFVI